MKNLICINNKLEFTFIEKRLCFEHQPELTKAVVGAIAAIEAEKERKKAQDKSEAENLQKEVDTIFKSFPIKWQNMLHDLYGLGALKTKGSKVADEYLIAHEAYKLGEIANNKGEHTKAKENMQRAKEFYTKVREYFNERLAKIKSLKDQIDQMWKRIPEIHKKSMRDSLLKYGDTADTLKQPYIKSEAAWKQAEGALSEENYENAIIEYQNVIEQYKIIAEIIGVNLGSAPIDSQTTPATYSGFNQHNNIPYTPAAGPTGTPSRAPSAAVEAVDDKTKAEKQAAENARTAAYDKWDKELTGDWKWKDRSEIEKKWNSPEAKAATYAGNYAWDSAEAALNKTPIDYKEAKKQFDIAKAEYQKLVDWQKWFKDRPDKTPKPLAVPPSAPGAAPSPLTRKKSPETGPETDETRLEKVVWAILEKHKYVGKEKQEHFDTKQLDAIKIDIEKSVKAMNLKPGTEINFGAVWVKVNENGLIYAKVEKPAEPKDSKKEDEEKLAAAEQLKLRNAAIRSLQFVTGESVAAIGNAAIDVFNHLSGEQKEVLKPGENITTRKGIILQIAQDKKSISVVSVDETRLKKEQPTFYAFLQSINSSLLSKKPGAPSESTATQVAEKAAPKDADAAAASSEGVRI